MARGRIDVQVEVPDGTARRRWLESNSYVGLEMLVTSHPNECVWRLNLLSNEAFGTCSESVGDLDGRPRQALHYRIAFRHTPNNQ
jgi:hypothetical protein